MRQKSGFSRVRKPHRPGRNGGGGLDSFIQSSLHHPALSLKRNIIIVNVVVVLCMVMSYCRVECFIVMVEVLSKDFYGTAMIWLIRTLSFFKYLMVTGVHDNLAIIIRLL